MKKAQEIQEIEIQIKTNEAILSQKHLFHAPPKQDYSNNFLKLVIVILISFVFITGEFVGGYISNSISVISDAFHLLTDLLGFVISFVFIYISRKPATKVMSFGYHRMEILGALGNLFIIWALAAFLLYEATNRLIDKEFVNQPVAMLVVGTVGLAVNILMYFVLHTGGHSHGLMADQCGHDHGDQSNAYFCCDSEKACGDDQCLEMFAFQEHCHVKIGNKSEVHLHLKKHPKSCEDTLVQINEKDQERKQNIEKLKKKFTLHEHNDKCAKKGEQSTKQGKEEEKEKEKEKEHNHEGHDHKDDDHSHQGGQSISMKAAVLHALSDVIQRIGLLISSLIIFFFGSDNGATVTEWNDWHYLDPLSTYIFSIIVILSTVPITKNCYYLIMEAAPSHIDQDELKQSFEDVKGVIDVHDIHLWELRPGKNIIMAHVFAKHGKETEVLKALTIIAREHKIYHSTFQVEEEQWKGHSDYIFCQHDIHD